MNVIFEYQHSNYRLANKAGISCEFFDHKLTNKWNKGQIFWTVDIFPRTNYLQIN